VCIPANGSHVGPIIMPFFEPGSPSLQQLVVWMEKTVSLNFCPEQYYLPQKDDFHMWNWTNNREYMTCRHFTLSGAKVGNWIVHWPSNVWTQIIEPMSNGSNQSAAYISDNLPTNIFPGKHAHPQKSTSAIEGLFDIRGRMIRRARVHVSNTSGVIIVRRTIGNTKQALPLTGVQGIE
jgi:hypothetical protein